MLLVPLVPLVPLVRLALLVLLVPPILPTRPTYSAYSTYLLLPTLPAYSTYSTYLFYLLLRRHVPHFSRAPFMLIKYVNPVRGDDPDNYFHIFTAHKSLDRSPEPYSHLELHDHPGMDPRIGELFAELAATNYTTDCTGVLYRWLVLHGYHRWLVSIAIIAWLL